MKYSLITYGCQMNKSDSERIAGYLSRFNFIKTQNPTEADLVILNTCSVRQSAEDRVMGLIENLKKIKTPPPKIALCGCMAAKNEKELKSKVDLVFKINDLPKLSDYLKQLNLLPKNSTSKIVYDTYFQISPKYENSFHAYVPIATGCNNFCTYCVVPYTRGREKSRAPEEILCEIKMLLEKGYKAITLLGQNVNSYGHDLKEKIDFPQLLKKIENLPYNFWLWFITSHPKDMSDKLIQTIAQSKKICPYIHLPAQAGDNKILAAMNRGYTREKYLKLIEKIKKALPEASLSTDIIVGFPGETKEQFQKTVDLFKEVKFDMAYIAEYSPRPKTAAWHLKNDVPPQEKKRRKKILEKLLREIALKKNKKLIGKKLEVLVETKKENFYFGKTKTFKTVKILPSKINSSASSQDLLGKIVLTKITEAQDFGLVGKLV